jgi:hypothetical protein
MPQQAILETTYSTSFLAGSTLDEDANANVHSDVGLLIDNGLYLPSGANQANALMGDARASAALGADFISATVWIDIVGAANYDFPNEQAPGSDLGIGCGFATGLFNTLGPSGSINVESNGAPDIAANEYIGNNQYAVQNIISRGQLGDGRYQLVLLADGTFTMSAPRGFFPSMRPTEAFLAASSGVYTASGVSTRLASYFESGDLYPWVSIAANNPWVFSPSRNQDPSPLLVNAWGYSILRPNPTGAINPGTMKGGAVRLHTMGNPLGIPLGRIP